MKKAKQIKQIKPQDLYMDTVNLFPGIFTEIDDVQAKTGTALASGQISNIIIESYGKSLVQAQEHVARVYALSKWRKNKQMYVFDYDIATELMNSFDSAEDIPVEAFDNMPYDSVHISIEGTSVGFFVSKDITFDKDKKLIKSLQFYLPIGNQRLDLSLRRSTIARCMTADFNAIMNSLDDPETLDKVALAYPAIDKANIKQLIENDYKREYERSRKILETCLSLLLYLCSQNAEVEYEGSTEIAREPKKEKSADDELNPTVHPRTLKAKPSAVMVGYRIGEAIRYHKQQEKSRGSAGRRTHESQAKRAAHVRRGHYHHYWVGSRRDDSRKLILKWVAPTFVNGHNEDELVPTIHNIK